MTHESGLQLRSTAKKSGELQISLERVAVPDPAPHEVVIRIEAAPINPSDLWLLTGPADLTTLRIAGAGADAVATADIPPHLMRTISGRLDESMPVGNEGAGTVVKAGASPEAQALLGKVVAAIGGAMYAQYRTLPAVAVLPLPADATAADGAACFVNPLTALGMVETMRREGHSGLVHTAAASNLGQMLVKLCLGDGVPLVNIVRSPTQAKILEDLGATHVVDSTSPAFMEELVKALAETGATLGFDAIGGGELASQILTAMEAAAVQKMKTYNRYGSSTHKQIYIYGSLDTGPTELKRSYGLAWGVGGWLLTPFLAKIGPEEGQRLRQRVVAELNTTFASRYTREISLAEALEPAVIRAYAKRATGEKFLLNPTLRSSERGHECGGPGR